jgi:hypothetical protein
MESLRKAVRRFLKTNRWAANAGYFDTGITLTQDVSEVLCRSRTSAKEKNPQAVTSAQSADLLYQFNAG